MTSGVCSAISQWLLTAVFAALVCCGPSRRARKDTPQIGTGLLRAEQVAGRWYWHHVGDVEAGRVVEVEDWLLEAHGNRLVGSIHRRVTVISTDGKPFDCNQSLHYTLDAFYSLRGVVRKGRVIVSETNVRVEPAPCEPGQRTLAHYGGTIAKGGLALAHAGGVQTLYRTDTPALAPDERVTVDGAWRWTNRYTDANTGEVTIEREEWQLTKAGSNLIGHYDRDVTVFSESGQPLSCGTGSSYQFRDRYAVRGEISDDDFSLAEIGADPSPHPCDGSIRRRLDHARGRVGGGQLILEWRGRRRQILQRADSPPAQRD